SRGTFSVSMSFDSFGTTSDGSKVWKLTANSHHKAYDGWWESYIDPSVKDAFANGITVSKFDPNAGMANHSSSQDRIYDVLKTRFEAAKPGNNVEKYGIERTADGFIVRYWVTTATVHWDIDTNPDFQQRWDGSVTLTLKYLGTADGVDQYSCVNV